MRVALISVMMAVGLVSVGCSSVDRSRDVGDARVPAHALAQQVCANCHGATGNSTSPAFPVLAGQNKEYIEVQLKSFRSHDRQNPTGAAYMWGLSSKLTDEQISGLAAYYADKPTVARKVDDTGLLAHGKEIFEKGVASANVPACATCHGDHAQGNQTFPRLAGQHADYIVKQLNVFKNTETRPGGAIMKPIASGLSDSDMQSVSAYLQSIGSN